MALRCFIGRRLKKIRLVCIDVDGVLTNGMKYYSPKGHFALAFDARDGLGIHLLQKTGVTVALLSNGNSPIVRKRAEDLGIKIVLESLVDKGSALRKVQEELGFTKDETLFIGDDLWDISAFEESGVKVAVRDSILTLLQRSDWVTRRNGGECAVREVAEAIIKSRNHDLVSLIKREYYFRDGETT